MLLALILTGFFAVSGLLAWFVADVILHADSDSIELWVPTVAAAGSLIGAVVGQSLFSAGLEGVLRTPEPPVPAPDELDRWLELIRGAVRRRRVLGINSQREQMLRGGTLMDLWVSRGLELRVGKGGKPQVKVGAQPEPWSRLLEQWSSGDRLVILGDPGYGKTFAALSLVDRINQDKRHVAELFPLVDWHGWSAGHPNSTIEEWMVTQLKQTYPDVSWRAVQAMIEQGRLVPVFDGLDELPADSRVGCLDALEAYAGRTPPVRPFVVTCRQREYLELAPKWVGAEQHVALRGLSPEQIAAVIRANARRPERWVPVIEAVEAGDKQVLSLLKSPLRLGAATEVYADRDPRDLIELAARDDAGEELWGLLLGNEGRSFEDTGQDDVGRWLGFIAASMQSHDRQRFWLHELYLFSSPSDRRLFMKLTFLVIFMVVAWVWMVPPTIFGVLVGGIYAAVLIGLYRHRRDTPLGYRVIQPRPKASDYLKRLPRSVAETVALSAAFTVALIPVFYLLVIATVLLEGGTPDLARAGPLVASWAAAIGAVTGALMLGNFWSDAGSEMVEEEAPKSLVGRGPGAVIRGTLYHALLTSGTGVVCLSILLVVGPGLERFWIGVLGMGLMVAWINGLEAWAFYHWTRWRLSRAGLLPRRLRAFLDWASDDTGWLRASDAYEFRHRELLDYLAGRTEAVGASNLSWTESRILGDGLSAEAVAEGRRGYRLLRLEDFEGAREAYETALEAAPGDPFFLRDLARAYDGLERYADQARAAAAAVEAEPDNPMGHNLLGIARDQVGDMTGALLSARRGLELSPEAAIYHGNLAIALRKLGRYREALAVVDAALDRDLTDPGNLGELRDFVAEALAEAEALRDDAEAAVDKDPGDPNAHWNLARTLRIVAEAAEAEAAHQRALALAIEGAGDTALLWSLATRGYGEDALRVAEGIESPSAADMAGVVLALGDLPEVERADERLAAARSAATTPTELRSLARALIAHQRWDDADRALDQASEAGPGSPELVFRRAELKLAAGDMQAARSALADALAQVDPDTDRPGDPGWICRLLWKIDGGLRREAIDVVVEEYSQAGFHSRLIVGLIEGTPTSSRQAGWDPAAIAAWSTDWGRHNFVHRGIGIIQTLTNAEVEDGVQAGVA